MIRLLVIGLLALSSCGHPAFAQTPRRITPLAERPKDNLGLPCDFLNLKPGCRYVPADGLKDPKALDVWQRIAAAALADLEYAKALSVAAGTPAANVRGQCWDALIVANKRAVGSSIALTKPDPHLASDAEALAELIDDLDLKGPLAVACSGAAQLFKLSVFQLISGLVTGAAGMAALGAT